MSDLELARELAGAAEKEVSAFRGMGDAAVFVDEVVGFYAQQAAVIEFKVRRMPARKSPTRWPHLMNSAFPGSKISSVGPFFVLFALYRSIPEILRAAGVRKNAIRCWNSPGFALRT